MSVQLKLVALLAKLVGGRGNRGLAINEIASDDLGNLIATDGKVLIVVNSDNIGTVTQLGHRLSDYPDVRMLTKKFSGCNERGILVAWDTIDNLKGPELMIAYSDSYDCITIRVKKDDDRRYFSAEVSEFIIKYIKLGHNVTGKVSSYGFIQLVHGDRRSMIVAAPMMVK